MITFDAMLQDLAHHCWFHALYVLILGADSNDNVASISSEDLPRSFENSRPFILRAEQFESMGKCNLTAVPISNSSLLNLNNNQSESRENTIVTVTVDPHGILMPTSQENNNEITSVMSLVSIIIVLVMFETLKIM